MLLLHQFRRIVSALMNLFVEIIHYLLTSVYVLELSNKQRPDTRRDDEDVDDNRKRKKEAMVENPFRESTDVCRVTRTRFLGFVYLTVSTRCIFLRTYYYIIPHSSATSPRTSIGKKKFWSRRYTYAAVSDDSSALQPNESNESMIRFNRGSHRTRKLGKVL
jgi:hypothetical protein